MCAECALHRETKYNLKWFFKLSDTELAELDKRVEGDRQRRAQTQYCGGMLEDLYPDGIDKGPSYRGGGRPAMNERNWRQKMAETQAMQQHRKRFPPIMTSMGPLNELEQLQRKVLYLEEWLVRVASKRKPQGEY